MIADTGWANGCETTNVGYWRDLMNEVTVSKFRSLFATMEAARHIGTSSVAMEVGSGKAGDEGACKRAASIGCDQYHDFARGSNGGQVGEGVLGSNTAGSRRRDADIGFEGTHGLTNGSKRTDVGEGV